MDSSLVSNDLYVLSLDGNLGAISQALDEPIKEPQSLPVLQHRESSTSIQIPLGR